MVNKKNNRSSFFCVFKYLIFILQHFLRWIFINSLSRGFYYSIKYSSTVTIGYGAKVTPIPIVTPSMIFAPAPIQQSEPITTGTHSLTNLNSL